MIQKYFILLLGIVVSIQGLYGEKNRISQVSVQEKQGRIEVKVQGSQKPTFTVFKLKNPLRLIVDISNATINGLESPINIHNGVVKQIITSQFEDDVNTTSRMMLSLQKDSRYSVKTVGNEFILVLEDQSFDGNKRIVQNVQTELLEHGNEIQSIRQNLAQKEKSLLLKEQELQNKEKVLRSLKEQLDSTSSKLQNQEAENQKLVAVLSENEKQLKEKNTLLDSLNIQLASNQKQIDQKQKEMALLKKQINSGNIKEDELKKLEQERELLSKNRNSLNAKLEQEMKKQSQLEKERKILAETLTQQKNIYASLEKDYQKILLKNKEAWENLKEAEEKNSLLSKENLELKGRLSELLQREKELQALSIKAKQLNQQNEQLKLQLENVAKGKNNLDRTVSVLKENNQSLSGENQTLSKQAVELSKENEKLKKELELLLKNKDVEKIMATNRNLARETKKILSSNEALLAENKKYAKEYNDLATKIENLSDNNKKLRQQLGVVLSKGKKANKDVLSKNINLENKNQQLLKETETLNQKNERLKLQLTKLNEAKKQISSTQSRLKQINHEKNLLVEKMQSLEKKNNLLQKEVTELKKSQNENKLQLVKEKEVLVKENQFLRSKIEESKVVKKSAPVVNDLKVLKYKDKIVVDINIKDYRGDFEILELENPNRLVVELPHAEINSSMSKHQDIGDALLKRIRLGSHKNLSKIVFDISENQKMPRYFLKKNDEFLSFTILTSSVNVGQNLVDLYMKEDQQNTSINLKFDKNIKYSLVREDHDLAVVRFYNVKTPPTFQNTLESQERISSVKMVSVFQSGEDTLLAVKLNNKTNNKISYDESSSEFVWQFKNKEIKTVPVNVNLVKKSVDQIKYIPSETASYSAQSVNIAQKQYQGKRISIDFKNADIHDVLQLIADVSRINIITADNVSGTVTMKLRNVEWDKALDVILKTKNLGKEVLGNIIRVAPMKTLDEEYSARLEMQKKADENIPMGVRLIPVNYARAEELVEQVKNLLTPKRGTVSVDVRTNVLIINDIFQKLDEAEALVRNLDTQTPQVLIEGRIVEASSTFTSEQGIQWGGNMEASTAKGNQTGLSFPSSVGLSGYGADQWMVNLPSTESYAGGGLLNFSLGSINDSIGLNLRIGAAEAEGNLKIISSPRISTLDNKEAMIETGVKIPIMTLNDQGVPTSKLIDAKITLLVTPHVTSDNSVILKLDLKKEEPDFSRVNQLGDPAIISKAAKTELILDDGETGVIGGMYTKKISSNERRVPVLGSIPVLGWFFKSKIKGDERSELLIFITPRIINRQKIMSSK